MELEHYQIPDSYKSIIEKFSSDPETAISTLKTRIEKRNAGAIGYFFLAWLHLKNNQTEEAAEAAWQARVRAPGSRFINTLHYNIVHPKGISAWQPEPVRPLFSRQLQKASLPHPIPDLDSLINKLASAKATRINLPADGKDDVDLSIESTNVDDIVTETLAVIHEKQENIDAAIATYKRLIRLNPDRTEHFKNQINRLKNIQPKKSKEI